MKKLVSKIPKGLVSKVAGIVTDTLDVYDDLKVASKEEVTPIITQKVLDVLTNNAGKKIKYGLYGMAVFGVSLYASIEYESWLGATGSVLGGTGSFAYTVFNGYRYAIPRVFKGAIDMGVSFGIDQYQNIQEKVAERKEAKEAKRLEDLANGVVTEEKKWLKLPTYFSRKSN